jgi:hypothetical protein
MTKEEYYDLLKSHDWFYEMSDDYSAYSRGLNERGELQQLAKDNHEFFQMYSEWICWYNMVYRGEQVDRPTL